MTSLCPDTVVLMEASEDNTDSEEIHTRTAGTSSYLSQVKPVYNNSHNEVTCEDQRMNLSFQQPTEECSLQEHNDVQGQDSSFQETRNGGQNVEGHREQITDLDELVYQHQQQNTGLSGAYSSLQRQNDGQGRKHPGQDQSQNHRPQQQDAEQEDAQCQEEREDKTSRPTTQSEETDENGEVQTDTSLSGPQQLPKTSCQMSNMTDSAQDFSEHQRQLPTKSPCLASDMTDSEDVSSERYDLAPRQPILEQIRPESKEKKQSREQGRGGRGRIQVCCDCLQVCLCLVCCCSVRVLNKFLY